MEKEKKQKGKQEHERGERRGRGRERRRRGLEGLPLAAANCLEITEMRGGEGMP